MLALTALHALALVAVAAWFTAALDLARINLVRTDSRRVLAESLRALALALRHLGPLVRVGLLYLGLLLAMTTAVVLLRSALPGGGWGWLALAVALQQLLAYSRLRLRVAAMASCVALVQTVRPKVAVVPAIDRLPVVETPVVVAEPVREPVEEPKPIGVGQ